MKARVLYLSLAAGVVVLIILVAFLTRSLLSVPADPIPVRQAKVPANAAQPQVTETVIDAASVTPAPPKNKPALPPEPLVVESPKPAAAPAPASPTAKSGIGELVSLRGTAVATGTNGVARALSLNARVFQNERIETGPAAKLKITFDDGSVLSQGENSTILIDEYMYVPAKSDACGFAMRIVKGTCRIITGLITKANPDRFKVHTRMATVGIRGCDVAFRSKLEQDDIYVLELAGEKMVVVNAAKDGSPLVDMTTGKELSIEDTKKQTVDIVEGGNKVSVAPGKGIIDRRPMRQDEFREVVTETSYLPPAQHDLLQNPDGATFTVKPGDQKSKPTVNPSTAK